MKDFGKLWAGKEPPHGTIHKPYRNYAANLRGSRATYPTGVCINDT